jgi:4-amino-4-deoxy-L-arabinose transferase-like glycosyltransferase
MGLSATASVLLVFLLARHRLSPIWALGAALAAAVSPILVAHAHYFDERTLLTTFLLASMVAFFRFVERPTAAATIWLGVATGLAWSSHFEAGLLVPLFAVAPLMGAGGPPRAFFARLSLAFLVASGVFLAVNWPLLKDVPLFVDGVRTALGHAASGHDVVVHGHYYWFAFHLLNSLAPGMTWPALAVATGGVIATAWTWTRADFRDRWILAAAVVFYFAVEIPPLKPWPDYSGYVVPVVPLLLYLGARGGQRLLAVVSSRPLRAIAGAGVASALILYPLYDAARLVGEMEDDTRFRAAAWLDANPERVLVEQYADLTAGGRSAAEFDGAELIRDGVAYVVASSFTYDRFRVGSRLPGQHPAVYRAQARYEALFAQPFIEIAPDYRSFAFSNPTIRIVDVRSLSMRPAP